MSLKPCWWRRVICGAMSSKTYISSFLSEMEGTNIGPCEFGSVGHLLVLRRQNILADFQDAYCERMTS